MKKRASKPRPLPLVAATAAAALMITACDTAQNGEGNSASDDESWPEDLRVVVVSSPGGGFDDSIRQIQPQLEEELGVNLEIDNQPGGSTAVGTTLVHNAEPDCNTVLITGIPHLIFTDLTQDVDYTFEDFYPVARLTSEPGLIRVANDAPWETLQDLVDDAQERPGEVTASVGFFTNNYYLGLLELQDIADIELNIVAYEGGAEARNALAAGEVDLTHAGAYNSRTVEEDTRVLAVHYEDNEWGEVTDDAPTVADALSLNHEDVENNDSSYGMFVPQECYEANPERHETLQNAVQSATEDEDYLALLEDLGEQGKDAFLPADEYHEMNVEEYEAIESIVEERSDEFQE